MKPFKSKTRKTPMLGCLWAKKKQSFCPLDRSIRVNESRVDYPANMISTSKYNALTFLPKNLFYQFSKLANIYFVIIGLLQMIKEISISNGIPFIYLPFGVIISVTMIKDLVEDYTRHKSDLQENNKFTKVFRNGEFISCRWRDLRVGNILMVEQNQFLPADLLLLKSSGEKGVCFIGTKNLDGETNLKQKQVHRDISTDFQTNDKIAQAKNIFKYEKPNEFIYKFVGSLETNVGTVSLGEQNLVLRGSCLKNTEYIIGLVAYTGNDTKIMMNSTKAKPKFSRLERTLNKLTLLIFSVQIFICACAGLYAAVWFSKTEDQLPYLMIDHNQIRDHSFSFIFFVRLGNWVLLLNGMVPISLLVTLEMVKVLQGILMVADPQMTVKISGVKTSVQSSNLNEELGQVDYIFSDKTGTLTQNIMEFKHLSVKGESYGDVRNLTETASMPLD